MDPTSHIDVRVSHHYSATPEQVFDAWLVPREMGRWMFGAHIHDLELRRLDVDPRIGGRFSLQMQRSGRLIEHTGHYLEIERPHRLSMAWIAKDVLDDVGSRLQIDLAPSGTGCVLVLIHRLDAKQAGHQQQVRDGWSVMLHALGELFAGSVSLSAGTTAAT